MEGEEEFEVVAQVEDVPEGGTLGVVKANGEQVCLVRRDGDVLAVSDVCTHQAFPMSAGEVLADGTIQCVWHGAKFDCRTGAVRQGPAEEPLPIYAVRVDGGDVLVGPRIE